MYRFALGMTANLLRLDRSIPLKKEGQKTSPEPVLPTSSPVNLLLLTMLLWFDQDEGRVVASVPRPRHSNGMQTTVELDASNRIVLSRELRRAAGIPRRQKLIVSATPGRIVLEMEANTSGRIVKRGKLKVWAGEVPTIPIEEAVKQSRHYTR
jgi:hypothetical protein